MLTEKQQTLYALMLKLQRENEETATTTYLAECLGVGQPALDRHLKALEAEGYVIRQQPPLRAAWRALEERKRTNEN